MSEPAHCVSQYSACHMLPPYHFRHANVGDRKNLSKLTGKFTVGRTITRELFVTSSTMSSDASGIANLEPGMVGWSWRSFLHDKAPAIREIT